MVENLPCKVLCLCAQNRRDVVRKGLSTGNYKLSFVGVLAEVTSAIADLQPDIFIHDWGTIEESQSRRFHLKFSQTSQGVDLTRILLVNEITPGLLAFASDALIDKVTTYGAASLNLGNELKMMREAKEGNELQKLLRESKLDTFRYNQSVIDKKIEELFARFPHDLKVKLEFANLNLRSDKVKEAAQLADAIIGKEPQNLRALNVLARARMKLGQWDEALKLMGNAQLLSPLNPERLIMMGDAFYGKGDLDKAVQCYATAMNEDPDLKAQAERGIGQIRLDQGQLEEALEMFKGSVSEEEAAGFFNNSAVQAVRMEQPEKALKLYETALKALRSDKLKPTIYYNIALTQVRLGAKAEAIKALRRSLNYDAKHEKAKQLLEKIDKGH